MEKQRKWKLRFPHLADAMDRNLDLNFDAETVERCLKLFKESYHLGRTTKPSNSHSKHHIQLMDGKVDMCQEVVDLSTDIDHGFNPNANSYIYQCMLKFMMLTNQRIYI